MLPRFIPAGAGNTANPFSFRWRFSVYPRWRGEHLTTLLIIDFIDGLSPLARGTLLLLRSLGLFHRFIPAGAGNTHNEALSQPVWPVYPRWRGEHT
ncbi:CRISPR associated protein [Salmonella enterica subsp. enterica serovar Typhimurium]|nr:CRISPR associated protein [Salmonella enterica subsp. enterica serovar Typhimurium]